MKKLVNFYINSSMHVALAVCALVGVTSLEFELPIDLFFIGFCFFGTITGYNYVKYAQLAKFNHKKLTDTLRSIQVFSLSSFIALIYFLWQLPLKLWWYSIPFGILTFLYAMPIFPKEKNLRSQAGVKVFVISVVWGGVTVILPILNANAMIDMNGALEMIQRFLFIVVLMLPFEIRDLKYDPDTLATIPQQIGVFRTKVFGIILLIICIGIEILQNYTEDKFSILKFFVVALITVVFLWKAKQKQSEYYSSFWVESIPIIWFCIVYLT